MGAGGYGADSFFLGPEKEKEKEKDKEKEKGKPRKRKRKRKRKAGGGNGHLWHQAGGFYCSVLQTGQ